MRIQAFENICYRQHKTNEYVQQQVNIIAGRQELLLSIVAGYHDSAMSVVMIRCRRWKEPWMVVAAQEDLVNHGRATSRRDRPPSMSSLLCFADNIGRWALTAALHLLVYPQRCLDINSICLLTSHCLDPTSFRITLTPLPNNMVYSSHSQNKCH